MARDSISTIIDKIRRQLNSTVRLEVTTLGASCLAADTTLTLGYDLADSIRPGAVLAIEAEIVRVMAIDVSAKEVTVIRGFQDSTAADHAVGVEVQVNPRFTRFDIFDAIYDEMAGWEPDLWTTDLYETTVADDQEVIELPAAHADCIGVIEVRRNWTSTDSTSWPQVEYRLQRGTSSWTAAPLSGLLVRFAEGYGRMQAGSVMMTIARPYDLSTLSETTAINTDLGVPYSYIDLITLGAKMRLMADDENGRSARNAQDEPRRNEDVQAGAAMSVAQMLAQRYERTRRKEVMTLRGRYPLRTW